MTSRHVFTALAVLVVLPMVAVAQQAPHPRGAPQAGFERFLFPPELVMQHQREIGLTAEQRSTMTDIIKDLQAEVLDLQWVLEDANQALGDLLGKPSVDAAAALNQIDQLLDIERRIKQAHLAHLIQIKNTLTAGQQEQLHQLARPRPPGVPAPRR